LNAQGKVCLLTSPPISHSIPSQKKSLTHIPGGWDRITSAITDDPIAQIEQAFANVDHTLKTAGSKGWQDVFSVKSYHVPLDNEALDAMVRCLKKWCPDHQPIWTVIGVPKLGLEGMKVEIDVRAHVLEERKD
jgi:enamine deaminase RidA (YjgF/YER057c/UK114 family)